MPKITFKAKITEVLNPDDSIAWSEVRVPKIARGHCDMAAFRTHPVYGPLANSDLFSSMIKRALVKAGIGKVIRLDRMPAGVTIEPGKFLADVTIEI